MISGVVLQAPGFRSQPEAMYGMLKWLMPLTYIRPHYTMDFPSPERDSEFLKKYKFVYEDPVGVSIFTLMTAKVLIEE